MTDPARPDTARADRDAHRERAHRARRRSTAHASACSTSASRAATCSSTALEELLDERGHARSSASRKPTFTKPAPVDLRHEIAHEVRRRDRGARRLRLVHVVQCARHREPRRRSGSRSCSSPRPSSSTRPRPRRRALGADPARRLRAAPDPGPHRRRAAGAGRRRASTTLLAAPDLTSRHPRQVRPCCWLHEVHRVARRARRRVRGGVPRRLDARRSPRPTTRGSSTT